MSLFRKTLTSLVATAACSLAILLAPSPAQATNYYYYQVGPFGSLESCNEMRAQSHMPQYGEYASSCYWASQSHDGGPMGYYFTMRISLD